jgi:hypothetical protein
MKWIKKLLLKLRIFIMSLTDCFSFEGEGVANDIMKIHALYATIKGDVIEITKIDGAIEKIPKSINNIGQLVGYCYVTEQYVSNMKVIDEEIPASIEKREVRDAWRKKNGLQPKFKNSI